MNGFLVLNRAEVTGKLLLFAEGWADFFAAGGAFLVFKKLRLVAPVVLTLNHQAFAALFAISMNKGNAWAKGTGYVQGPSASGASGVPYIYFEKAGRAGIIKGTGTSAFIAYPRIAVYQLTAMYALLLVKSHFCILPLFCLCRQTHIDDRLNLRLLSLRASVQRCFNAERGKGL